MADSQVPGKWNDLASWQERGAVCQYDIDDKGYYTIDPILQEKSLKFETKVKISKKNTFFSLNLLSKPRDIP